MAMMNKEDLEYFKDYKLASPITVDEYGDSYFLEMNKDRDTRAVRVDKQGNRTVRYIPKQPAYKFKLDDEIND